MEILVISLVALVASGLTLFSGFGLGTLLMPVVAIFFPIEIAVAITAVVHLAANLFKFALFGKRADRGVVIRFGGPAIVASFVGAFLLVWLSSLAPIGEYFIGSSIRQITPIKLIVGVLILAFVLIERSPSFALRSIGRNMLPLGGLISGFFGGLSGNQGAFRSMFLIKAGLTKEQFIATGIVIAVLVDIARMSVYGWDVVIKHTDLDWMLIAITCVAAFIGAFVGSRFIEKVTIGAIQMIVSILLAILGLGLITGLL